MPLKDVPACYDGSRLEEEILQFWQQQDVFAKCLEQTEGRPLFSFNEGPPTANGKPGLHHVLARAFKDIYLRYRTMRGFYCPRKAGWDCHGLPVEHEVEKELGIFNKQEIESRVGIEEFNRRCRQSVMRYVKPWAEMTQRMGFWVDLENAYFTLDNDYIESVWQLLKIIWDKGFIKKDYKVVPYDPQAGVTLSSHEVALGYKEVEDPSVFVRFRLQDKENTSLLAWTTTPWTLPANFALAVNPEAEYLEVEVDLTEPTDKKCERLIVAQQCLEAVFSGVEVKIIRRMQGHELAGMRYQRLFDEWPAEGYVCRIVAEKFVGTDEGTGIVHLAPYGAEDMEVARKHGFTAAHVVGMDGKFLPHVSFVAGKFFKDADKSIIKALKDKGLLFRMQIITHSYPHGWRTGVPLMYYPKEAWFIRTSQIRARMVELNQSINWIPDHIKDGRFGNWLSNNVDWALSRERFWGTPLPIWTDGEEFICVGSVAELEKLCGKNLMELDLHRPAVDKITFPHPKTGRTMSRVPEVIDCWFDSGAMPYAQWHYPFENKERFQKQFPADFICEAIDQTRGWFYSLHAVATLISDQASFQNVICLSHIVDENGCKMSKSLGNVIAPFEVFNKVGADPLRWHFLARVPPEGQKRVSLDLIRGVSSGFINTYWNIYAFFINYAKLDKINFNQPLDPKLLTEIDRWILALLGKTILTVSTALDNFDARTAGDSLERFVNQLSNWYIRRNRYRFWKSEPGQDKQMAYLTLGHCLYDINRMLAPFMPFITEEVHKNLASTINSSAPVSVHLDSWPKPDDSFIDQPLVEQMNVAQKVVSLGRAAREKSAIRVRQPLSLISIYLPDEIAKEAVLAQKKHILEELNIKKLEFLPPQACIAQYQVKPNLPRLGKKLGPRIPVLKKTLAALPEKSIAQLQQGQSITITLNNQSLNLSPEDVLIETTSANAGQQSAASEGKILVIINTSLNEKLLQEGLARELIRSVQEARKQAQLKLSDRINLHISGSEIVQKTIASNQKFIMSETLATHWATQKLASFTCQHKVNPHHWTISLEKSTN